VGDDDKLCVVRELCDEFCKDIKAELNVNLKPRFSPGYGDLDLSCQKDIFKLLDCSKKIGLTLNDSLLMSPTKSVTAFVGIY
jgi:5-methyltetrahydrofolate--homocysteine methyltransferase